MEGDKGRGIFEYKRTVKDSPGRGSRSFIHSSFMRAKDCFLAQPLLRGLPLTFGRLVGLGTNLAVGETPSVQKGSKNSIQPPPEDAPLAPVGPFFSILASPAMLLPIGHGVPSSLD